MPSAALVDGEMDSFPYKVELHVHLDGAVRPQTVLDIAQTKKRSLPAQNVAELKKECTLSKPADLKALLHCFDIFLPVIAGDRDAVSRIAYEFCEDCAKQDIRYVEVRFSPHLLCNAMPKPEFAPEPGNFSPRDVVTTVLDSLNKGSLEFNLKVNSILCCMTHRPDWSLEIVQLCKDFKGQGVVAIDSAGQDFEPGKPPSECLHKQAFKDAYQSGVHRTVHAGENGPAEGVREALDHMYAERIGHGYHVMDDPHLVERCKKDNVHFEMCPVSSIRTKACPEDISLHPILKFAKEDMNFSINTDDPIVLDNNLTEDYEMAFEMGLNKDQIVKSIYNAARSSFASDSDKAQILKDLKNVYKEF